MKDNIILQVKEARERVKREISSGVKYKGNKIGPLAIGKRLSFLRLSPSKKLINKLSGNLWLRSMLAKNLVLHDFVRNIYRKILFRNN
jgi:hypothetical protein